MTLDVAYKLLAILTTVGLGWLAGRFGWLGLGADSRDPARVLSNAALYIFVPALLFRTTARVDLDALPLQLVAAYFVPAVALAVAVHLVQHGVGAARRHGVAAPATRAVGASFGNSVQLGIPMAAALFGEAGLALHLTLVSLHALILLTVPTALVELDLARARLQGEAATAGAAGSAGARIAATLAHTTRQALIHPVVLPVVAGLLWNLTGLGLHPLADEVLVGLGSAVVPLCLVLIGLSLAYYGLQGRARGAAVLTAVKLLLLPALVLVVAYGGFGLQGMPLAVLVMMAALPVGSNALIFAQRYDTLKAEATGAIVFSTLAFGLTAPLWLALLGLLGALPAP
jgi:malonate transporter and related proteins